MIVGIGEMATSSQSQDNLITLGLGSCVALVVSHRDSRSGALAHIALPNERWDQRNKDERPPAFYADHAVAKVFARLSTIRGFSVQTSEVSIIGGASNRAQSKMQVGRLNVDAVLAALENLRISPKHQLTGGTVSRNVRLEVRNGEVWVREPDSAEQQLSKINS